MKLDHLFEILNRELVSGNNRPLNSTETLLLQGIWQYQTYSQIADEIGYSPGYLTNVVAPELLHRLSQLAGQRLTKKNCRIILESLVAQSTSETRPPKSYTPPVAPSALPSFPSGPIAVNSPFYIARPPIETQVFEELQKPGALVRVKAPKEMGKTSLLLQVLHQLDQREYRTVYLSLEQIDRAICDDLNRFLRWLCVSVSHQLQLEPKLDEYWDDDIGSKVSCTLYFRNYLLSQLKVPLVLALDEVNQLFEHPLVAQDVLPLLRSWYEEAKRLPIWQNFRLIMVHSTEVYVPLQLNQSPFNVGFAAQLTSFTLEQVQQLAQRYHLDWESNNAAHQLMNLVGGHPALIHVALYYLSRGELTLDRLLEVAPTSTGIYQHHLQRHWVTLQEQPALAHAFGRLLGATEPIHTESTLAHKLTSMGLIHQSGNEAIVSCQLYQQYFREMLDRCTTE
ncbi:AAA-like domain-containing protein [Leptolyngbya sp. NIES-2104]|uniref:AAA-like domain-containing protein n=1 Tax=Leptolyngbya sp. NIES-2104 TaxID=1552121 RepID=UPI0006EC68A3|nr:AAA-like domain-containing protein [Leptolyngbya sp. NIES-2104]GAP94792.1 WD40 repeat [Leptolyngbya sp. NIES-2104]